MKKLLSVSIFIAIIFSLLVACGKKDDGENENVRGNEETLNNEEQNEEDEENAENEENEENNSNENLEDEEEDIEGTFAAEIKVMDVETVLLDQDKVSSFKTNEQPVIEHEEILYVEHEFITKTLDYELTYDEENTFAEVFERKGDFRYESSHEDDHGALMDVGQIYVEDVDNYINITEDEEFFKFIEYEGKLYLSERFINVFLKSPLNYERRDQILEVGLRAEATSIYDVGLTENATNHAEVTKNSSDVTVEGKNYEGGILLKDVNSSDKKAPINVNYNYSEVKGFVHNYSDEETLEIKFQYDDDKTLDTINLKPGESQDFVYDVKGEYTLQVIGNGKAGTSSDVVIIGELK